MIQTTSCVPDEDLWDLLDSSVSEVEAARREHVASCPTCRVRLDELRHLHEGLEVIGRAPDVPQPASIGPYRIVRLIGQGSGGIVYEAEQAEPARRVALKVLRQIGAADHHRLRAFQREIRTLARLDHPAIAQIYDAGRTEDEQVYFAMQLVDGRALDRFCDVRGLSLRERVRLSVSIVRAVHHAHQRGVLHRDLKPANILVDEQGRPKVLDFGLALSVSSDSDLTVSINGARIVGTLPYMSPEHVDADVDVDVRADVYSLGVILYRLVTACAPYDLPTQLDRARTVIMETQPLHPSKVSPRIPHELGDVVMKALEKDRERRYSSAAGLADDLERFLGGEAVEARPMSSLYRVRVFIRRNKSLTVGIAGVVVALSFGFATTLGALRQVQRQQDDTQAVAQLMSDALRNADKRTAGVRTLRNVLDGLTQRLEEEPFSRPTLEEAMLREDLGLAYLSERSADEAVTHLDRALELRAALLREDDPAMVRSRYAAGLAHFRVNDFAGARRQLARNRELHLAGVLPPSLELAASLAWLTDLETMFDEQGNLVALRAPVDGELLFAEALEMVRSLPASRERTQEEATILYLCAFVASEIDDKIRLARRSVELCEETGRDIWDSLDPLEWLARILVSRSRAWMGSERDAEEAAALLARRVRAVRELFGEGLQLANAYALLAGTQIGVDPAAAAGAYARALELERTHAWTPVDDAGRSRRMARPAIYLAGRADALRRAGDDRSEVAEAELTAEIARLDTELAADGEARVRVHVQLRRSADARGQRDEERSYLRQIDAIREEESTLDPRQVLAKRMKSVNALDARPLEEIVKEILPDGVPVWGPPRGPRASSSAIPVDLALTRVHAGHGLDLDELRGLVERTEERNAGFFSMDVSEARWALGLSLIAAGELEEAEALLREGVAYYNVYDDAENRISHWALARALRASGKDEEAREVLGRSYSIEPFTGGLGALIRCDTALAHLETDERDKALAWLDEALPVLRAGLGDEHHYVREVLDRVVRGSR